METKAKVYRPKKLWTVAGTVILLLSWATQTTLWEYYDSKFRDLEDATQRYSNAYNASLQYATMFFASSIATDVANYSLLQKAVRENAYGFAGSIEPLPIDKSEKAELILDITSNANNIKSLEDYNKYISKINQHESKLVAIRVDWRASLERKREISSYIYLLLYLLGTAMLVRGFWLGE